MRFPALLLIAIFLIALSPGIAQNQLRPIPPPGVAIPAPERTDLEARAARLGEAVARLKTAGHELWPDVAIFHKAADWALRYNEFFRAEESQRARQILDAGLERAAALQRGESPWTRASGLVVRGYVSRIDESVQPYGLVIPETFTPRSTHRWRVDAWFHGRNETLSELNFLYERMRNPGEFTPPTAIVLHLYGRYCNANKFAGEVDLFEALAAVRKHYPIDGDRILVRGFSMGGAAAWHIAAHHAGQWAAAAPGAGFSESADFLKVFNTQPHPPAWEQKLWRLYDATEYAVNLEQVPTVAYSGEIDRQKQAADMMDKAMTAEGLRMVHIIGPNTPHRYHPDSKVEINARLDAIAERGRDRYPRSIRFTTATLRYNRLNRDFHFGSPGPQQSTPTPHSRAGFDQNPLSEGGPVPADGFFRPSHKNEN
ncbi:MAG: hypothetical protein FJW40_24155 [Acidobacteria bacterium]|nr:hypothetical protein [Acidobacteriota bacterium]